MRPVRFEGTLEAWPPELRAILAEDPQVALILRKMTMNLLLWLLIWWFKFLTFFKNIFNLFCWNQIIKCIQGVQKVFPRDFKSILINYEQFMAFNLFEALRACCWVFLEGAVLTECTLIGGKLNFQMIQIELIIQEYLKSMFWAW